MKRFLLCSLAALLFMFVASCSNDDTAIDNPEQTVITDPVATCTYGIQNGSETGIDCGGDCESCLSGFDIQGTAQKGPFLNGSSVLISELGTDFIATGRTFSAQILDNQGTFEVSGIELESNVVNLRVDGFYFNEVCGTLSAAQITLNGIASIREGVPVNLNVLTHLEQARVAFLMDAGAFYTDAKAQAQGEILAIFNIIPPTTIGTSEELDISGSSEGDAILIAISSILQGYRLEGEFSTLMANIITDIRTDGALDDLDLGANLVAHAKLLDADLIASQIEARYDQLGIDIEVPEFGSYISNFLSATSYPDDQSVIDYPENGVNGPNILSDSESPYIANSFVSLAANIPVACLPLKITITANDPASCTTGCWAYSVTTVFNWDIENYDFTENSQTFNSLEDACDLGIIFQAGTYTIEYFENGANTPTRTKTITVN